MAEAVQLAALRVSAEIDAIGVAKGAAEIESATARAGAAMKALQGALSAADRAAGNSPGIEKLKRQFIDGYGSAKNLERALNTISNALDRGKISAEAAAAAAEGAIKRYGAYANVAQFAAKGQHEYAAAIERANASLNRQAAARPMAANQNMMAGGQQFAAQNLMYQMHDIGVTAAMGMNPLMIALQQGTQISAALGPMGASGAVRSLGAAFAALVSPLSLMTVGLTAATAAAIQYFTSASDGASKSKTLLDQQNEAIRAAAQAWGAAAPALQAVVDKMDRAKNIDLGRAAYDALASREFDGLSKKLDGINQQFVMAGRSLRQMQADPELVRDFGQTFSDLRSKLEKGTASIYDLNRAQRILAEALSSAATKELRTFSAEFDQITASINRSADAARQLEKERIKSLAGGYDVQSIIENNRVRVGENDYTAGTFIPKNVPTPTERPKIELEGGTDAGAKGDIAAMVRARQSLIQTQQEGAERLQLEIQLLGASSRERAMATAKLDAEIELRRQGISTITEESRAYIVKAQAMAAARVEAERLNQLAVSRDPAGSRSNLPAQVQAREALFQSQRDEIDMLEREAQLIGASSKERAISIAGLQAEQTLRRQGIEKLTEEGKAYIANAQAMAAARVEIERQNQLALSRDPAGARGNTVERVQAAANFDKAQQQEIAALQQRANVIGLSSEAAARSNAVFQAEQQMRQQGLSLLGQEADRRRALAAATADYASAIQRSEQAYASWQQAGSSAIDALTASTGTLGERLKGMADAMLSWVTQMALANPLKNALFGTNLPTFADLGKPQVPGLAATSTASMMVTAGVVNVAGGQFPGIPGVTPSDSTSSTLGSFLGYKPAAANQNQNPALAGLMNDPSLASRVSATTTAPAGSIEAYIRQAALQRGIDPNVAVKVAQSEGGLKSWNLQSQYVKNGVQEQSYGPFQLYKGGGLGNDFMNKTGLDPALAANGPAGVDFALDHASKNGWGAWYGAKRVGVSNWEGIGKNPGVDTTTTNSIQQSNNALKQLSSTTSNASKDIGTLGDTSTKLGTQLTDGLGKLTTPVATPQVPAVTPTVTAAGSNPLSALFGWIPKLFGFADGTDYSPGGMAWVGERGRELVNLPRGSQVVPNHKLNQVGGGGNSGPRTVRHEYNITVSGNGDKELMERMRMMADDTVRAGIGTYDAALPERIEQYRMYPDHRG